MTPKQVNNYLKGETKKRLLDVRTPLEYSSLRIGNAINLNLYDELFEEKVETLDQSLVYICYCKTGSRSRMVVNYLRQLGFSAVNLRGGIEAWIDNDLAVEEH